MPADQRPVFDLTQNWSTLTRNVLIVLVGVYFAQLAAPELFTRYLMWLPLGGGFQPWQVVTSFFVQGTPFQAFFGWLAVFFFLTPVHRDLGPRTFWQATGAIWAGSVLLTLGAMALGVVEGGQFGFTAFITMLIGFFGFRNPNAQIYFYFVPLRAIWLAWADGALSLLWLLYAPSPITLLPLLFWAGSWLWCNVDGGGMRRARLKWKRRQVEKKLARFEVIEGGRDERKRPEDWVN